MNNNQPRGIKMGQSTDGILVFGFDLGVEDESPDFLGEFDDLTDLLSDEAGLTEWRNDFTDAQSSAYFKTRRELEAACPVDIVLHCSGDYPMYILAIRGYEYSASRGSPEIIEMDKLIVDDAKIQAAKEWCEAHGIEWQEPKWVLASYWG